MMKLTPERKALLQNYGPLGAIFFGIVFLVVGAVTVVLQWLPTWLPLVTVGVLLTSVGIAMLTYAAQKEMVRKRATLDFLNRNMWDSDCLAAAASFNMLARPKEKQVGLEFWADERHRDTPQLKDIKAVLNDYELIALGIRKGIIDEDFYRAYYRTTTIRDWDWAKAFVEKIRCPDAPFALKEFECLVEAWRQERDYAGSPSPKDRNNNGHGT